MRTAPTVKKSSLVGVFGVYMLSTANVNGEGISGRHLRKDLEVLNRADKVLDVCLPEIRCTVTNGMELFPAVQSLTTRRRRSRGRR